MEFLQMIDCDLTVYSFDLEYSNLIEPLIADYHCAYLA